MLVLIPYTYGGTIFRLEYIKGSRDFMSWSIVEGRETVIYYRYFKGLCFGRIQTDAPNGGGILRAYSSGSQQNFCNCAWNGYQHLWMGYTFLLQIDYKRSEPGGGGGDSESHIKKTEVLVGNFDKNLWELPMKDPVLWVWLKMCFHT